MKELTSFNSSVALRVQWFHEEHNVTRRCYTVVHVHFFESHWVKGFSPSLQRMESRGQWVEFGRKRWGTGKTIDDLMLFWETNKGANVAPREACGPVGCHARCAARNWWAGFHNKSKRVMKLKQEEQWQVCMYLCVCVWLWGVLVIKVFDRGEQLSRLVITSQQKHGQTKTVRRE